MPDIQIELIAPSAAQATDRFMMRRGAGPADHTIQLVTPGTVKAFLGLTTADVSGLAAIAVSGSAADLVAGILPAARFDDTSHGSRAGGALHAAATGAVAGFMAAADKTKLDGIAAGANNYSHPNHSGDVTSVGDGATTIASNAVTNAKAADMATATIKGRVTAGTGDPEDLTVAQTKTLLAYTPADIGAATAAQANATHTGDATGATVLTLATVNSNVGSFGLAGSVAQFVVNAKGLITSAANVAISIASTAISDSTAAGRAMLTAATAAAQTALLDTFTVALKGLVPPPGTATGLFLRDDGTWAASGGGSPVTVQDEGANITTALGTLNFTGAGVTVTGGATAVVNIPGGGGGLTDGDKGDVTVSGSGTIIRVDPQIRYGLPLALARSMQF
ncbi:MAG: hypothetical protein ACRC6I_16600 [Paracoccaceae bacterium]